MRLNPPTCWPFFRKPPSHPQPRAPVGSSRAAIAPRKRDAPPELSSHAGAADPFLACSAARAKLSAARGCELIRSSRVCAGSAPGLIRLLAATCSSAGRSVYWQRRAAAPGLRRAAVQPAVNRPAAVPGLVDVRPAWSSDHHQQCLGVLGQFVFACVSARSSAAICVRTAIRSLLYWLLGAQNFILSPDTILFCLRCVPE